MKLPKREDKFVVNVTYEGDDCSFYGFVVSGVHIEIRGDDVKPDFVWYYVCADKVYDGLFSGKCLHVALCLEHALEFIAEKLTPYQEQEEKADEEPAAEAVESVNPEVVPGNMVFNRSGSVRDGNDSRESAGSLCSSDSVCGIPSGFPGKILRGCVIPEAAAALDHVFTSFNSLAADLLHMQYVLAPAPSGTGGAAYV